ncbi:MAG: hypothetical protein K0Q79_3495 [Flavipsychrobacter sp.]|jgi:hypothetical protein|nr:hypothetical protein [Flavipsychrobacter sp.]
MGLRVKYIPVLLIIGAATLLFSSCINCTCEKVTFWGIHFNNYNRATDSFARVEVYPRDLDFGLVLSSSEEAIGFNGDMSYNFNFNYDYKIIVLPAGRVYTLQNLSQDVKSKKTIGSDCKDVRCAHSYKLNGVAFNTPEQADTTGATYISVN